MPRLVSWSREVVKHYSSWQQNGIYETLHSAEGHCYLRYTQPYSDLFYITSCVWSSLPPSLFTEHVDEGISTKDSQYGSTEWANCLATAPWQQSTILRKWFTTCHQHRQSIWETRQSLSSAAWVWLLSFTAAISRRSAVLSPFSIQHDTQQFTTNHHCKPTISKLWATVARIWPPPRRLWQVSNLSPAAVPRTRAFISGCTESASRTAGKQSSNWPTSSSSTAPPGPPSWARGRPPISLPTNQFLPPAELPRRDVARIEDLPPWPEISYTKYDANDESDNFSDLGCAECKPPVSLKQTQFSLKQFAKTMGQANYSTFNQRKKVWVSGFLEKKHHSIIWGLNLFKQLRDGPLHWETAVADCLQTFETWLPLNIFDNAEWICRQ